jgi:hypothetical protein
MYPKKHVELVSVLLVSLTVPPNTFKQHLAYMFFRPKVGEMFIDDIQFLQHNKELSFPV